MFANLSILQITRLFSKHLAVRCLERLEPLKGCIGKANFNTALASRTRVHKAEAPVVNYSKKCIADLLAKSGINSDAFKEHQFRWVFKIEPGILKEKIKLIKGMNFKEAEHSIPFFKLSPQTLLNILKAVKADEHKQLCTNRLYYLSDHLKVDPSVLSAHLSKRTFIYTLSFDWFQQSLKVLLEMGVPPERIIKDLWVFKYHHETIRKRLTSVKTSGRDLIPWMVRCPEDVLQRSIQISQNTKTILGDNISTQAYLAKRLNTSLEVISVMYSKIPSVETMRVTKAKSCLDFLFAEGFTEVDIINVPRILAHSLKTIKSRLAQLRAIGVNSKNLNILCKSKKDFKKYYDANAFNIPKDSPLCRGCMEENETAEHVLLQCNVLSERRRELLLSPTSLAQICRHPGRLVAFMEDIGWLG